MLRISDQIILPDDEITFSAIRAQGAGGQNVNKVATAIHLRFDIRKSSLSDACKERLLASGDRRITRDGVVIIKAQRFRSQEKNRADALDRLRQLLKDALATRRKRRPTRVPAGARRKRLDSKTRRGKTKALRGKVVD